MKKYPLHSFLIALYPAVFLYYHNSGELWPTDLFVTSGIILTAAFISFVAIKYISGNLLKTGLISGMLWAGFYLFAFVSNTFYTYIAGITPVLYVFSLIWLVSGGFFLFRKKKPLYKYQYKDKLVYTAAIGFLLALNILLTDIVTQLIPFFAIIVASGLIGFLMVFLLKKIRFAHRFNMPLYFFSRLLLAGTILYFVVYQSSFESVSHTGLFPLYLLFIAGAAAMALKVRKTTAHNGALFFLLTVALALSVWNIEILYANLLPETALSLCLLYIAASIYKSSYNYKKLNAILNYASLALILIPLIGLIIFEVGYLKKIPLNSQELTAPHQEGLTEYPDIYYIVLDEYASKSTVSELFNYDNTYFEKQLADKGFYVGEWESFSSHTHEVIAGVLNLDTSLTHKETARINFNNIRQSRLTNFLKQKGYALAQFPMWRYEKYTTFDAADIVYKTPIDGLRSELKDYNSKLLFPSLLRRYIKSPVSFYENAILSIRDSLPLIRHSIPQETPLFVYAHFICPHAPFVFDSLGQSVGRQYDGNSFYLGQHVFTNNMVLALADSLLVLNGGNNIIIIQSDHGPREGETGIKTTPEQERRILTALYFPNSNYSMINDACLYNNNTFKYVLNIYFETHLTLDCK